VTAAAITGLGTHRPARREDNSAVARRTDSSDEWIRARSGIVTRGVAEPDETIVEMAVSAGGKALAASGVDPQDVGLVIVATCTQTQPMPGAAGRVAARLGARSAGSFDLGAACSGFTYGLSVAADMVRGGSARHVLVIGSEKFTDILDPSDRGTAFLFGDGAGAAVVSASDVDGISRPVWLSDGDSAQVLRTEGDPPVLQMEGRAVYRWATGTVPDLARAACEKAGIGLADLAAFVPHQANLRITEAVVKSLRLPEHVAVARDVVDSGNTSAASVPLALDRLLDRGEVRRGDRVLLVGFGAGLTAAALVVTCP
jgi:3-oxoacyl-[acyl-carrier-protein] synthase III